MIRMNSDMTFMFYHGGPECAASRQAPVVMGCRSTGRCALIVRRNRANCGGLTDGRAILIKPNSFRAETVTQRPSVRVAQAWT